MKLVKGKSATFAANGLLLLFIATLAGLLWSRALLSVIHVAWLLVAIVFIVGRKIIVKGESFINWSIVPLILFLLGVYQQPLAKANYDYLLTLSIYPIAAIGSLLLYRYVNKDINLRIWTVFALVSLLLPLVSYLLNLSEVYELYAKAKTLPVWMGKDHVRYGLFISSAFLFLISYKLFSYRIQYFLLSICFLMIVFISIRTAWLAAGIIITISGWDKIKQTRYSKMRWLIPLGILIICFGSYHLIDSVKGKVDYTLYDWQNFDEKKYDAHFSDGARRAINYTAYKTVTTDGVSNVGWAAIPQALQNSFAIYFPGQNITYGWPFNQWLFWWIGGGWWTMALYAAWLLYPLVWGIKNKNYCLCSWTLVIAASCVVESTLSLQYGVFLHGWVTALIWISSTKAEYDNS